MACALIYVTKGFSVLVMDLGQFPACSDVYLFADISVEYLLLTENFPTPCIFFEYIENLENCSVHNELNSQMKYVREIYWLRSITVKCYSLLWTIRSPTGTKQANCFFGGNVFLAYFCTF